MELVFEDISTFDAENPMVRSLLREIDLNKKQTDSNFIKSPPIHPGKEFEIKKRLDRLRGIKRVDDENNNNNNNNNGNDGGGGGDLFGPPRSTIPTVPNINNLLNPPPEEYDIQQRLNRLVIEGEDLLQEKFNALKNPAPRAHPNEIPFLANTYVPAQAFPFRQPAGVISIDLFGSQAATAIRSKKTKTQAAIDDAIYEFPDHMPELELGDSLIETLGTNTEELFNVENLTSQEKEDQVFKKIKEEYGFEDIKDTMDEERNVRESIYFFLWCRERKIC